MKTVLIIIGAGLMLLMALIGYACVVAASDAECQMEEWERERNAGRN